MSQHQNSKSYSNGWVFLLTLLTAFSALSTDMYLPALPTMAEEYGVSTQEIANTLGAYFLGLAFGQLLYGPLSDRYGRKPPLYFGLIIYIVASLCCAVAPNDTFLIASRVLQAFGGCAGVVIVRAAIRDHLSLNESAHVYSSMVLVMGLAPIIAPAFGVLLLQFFHWSSIFYLLTMIGVITLGLVHLYFDETLAQEQRAYIPFNQIIKNYFRLFITPAFALPMFAGTLSYSIIYCYISASSNLFMDFLHIPKQNFAYFFGINALSLMFFSYLNKRLIHVYPIQKLFIVGCFIQSFGIILINFCAWLEIHNIYAIMTALFFLVGGLGFTGPNSIAIVMQSQSQHIGLSSALMGFAQFFIGFVLSLLLSLLPFNILQNMSLLTLLVISLSLSCTWYYTHYLQRITAIP
ncbi:multidrug effflux MFS transporter [Acinetobacter sp. KS-LM10]|uniref:multidrug effflux MFS transporter n=1 Tax=Acinetobacter sp. KS-LM10 TaxID=3120518 RepID=UPI0030D17D06